MGYMGLYGDYQQQGLRACIMVPYEPTSACPYALENLTLRAVNLVSSSYWFFVRKKEN